MRSGSVRTRTAKDPVQAEAARRFTAFSGTTQSIVCHIAVLYGGPMSRFRRNRKAAPQAIAAATTSWANASQTGC